MNYTEEAKKKFSSDIYASEVTGIEIIHAEPGYAKCRLKINEKHKNANGEVMGGVIFTIADYAFAIASNLCQATTVTQTSQIVYMSCVRGNEIYAETEKIKDGKKTCLYRVNVFDDLGNSIAYVTVTGFILA